MAKLTWDMGDPLFLVALDPETRQQLFGSAR